MTNFVNAQLQLFEREHLLRFNQVHCLEKFILPCDSFNPRLVDILITFCKI
jgi:hypothetical protein